jgi:hypothetical protein
LAINTITVTTANVFIPEVWAADISDATQATCVLPELVDRSFDDEVANFGQIIHISDLSNPAVRVKAADTAATYSNVTETDQDITINRHIYCAFLQEDMVKIQARVDLQEKYASKTGYSLMAFIEGDITSGLCGLPDNFSQTVGTLGNDPTDDDLIRATQYLDDGDVPRTDRFIYASPAYYHGLRKLDRFTRQEYVGQDAAEKAVKQAMVGKLENAPVYMSSLANGNPAAASQSYSWFCHKQGVTLIMQRTPTVHQQFDLLNIGTGTVVDAIFQHAERLLPPSTLGGGTSDDRFNVSLAGA